MLQFISSYCCSFFSPFQIKKSWSEKLPILLEHIGVNGLISRVIKWKVVTLFTLLRKSKLKRKH